PHCCVTANCSEDSFFFSSAASGFLKSFMVSGSKVKVDVSAGCTRPWRTIATRPAASNTIVAIPAILIEDIRFSTCSVYLTFKTLQPGDFSWHFEWMSCVSLKTYREFFEWEAFAAGFLDARRRCSGGACHDSI